MPNCMFFAATELLRKDSIHIHMYSRDICGRNSRPSIL